MDFVRKNIAILFIIAIGFILRFSISIIHSYSNDELSAITRLDLHKGADFIEKGVKTGDMHPAGVQVFLKAWSSLFGTSEAFLRFPFVIFGCLSIWMLFLLAKKWFNKEAAIIASGLLAFLYFPIMNSEFARPYSIGLLATLLVVYFWQKILFEEGNQWKNAIILGVCFAASLYIHYFQFIVVASIGLIGLFYLNRRNYKYYLLASVIGVVLFVPHIPITIYHLNVGGLQWLAPPGKFWLFEFVYHVFNSSWWLLIIVGVLFIIGLFRGRQTTLSYNKQEVLPLAIFLVTFVLGFILSYTVTPVLKFPVMLFVLPFLFMVLGKYLSRLPYLKLIVPSLFLLVILSTIFEKKLYGNQHYGVFREISEVITGWDSTYGEENIYKIVNANNIAYFNFYAHQNNKHHEFNWVHLEYGAVPAIRADLMNSTEAYCIVGYSARNTVPQLFETVKEFYPHILSSHQFNNAAVFLLGKGVANTEEDLMAEFSFEEDIKGNWVFNADQQAKNQSNELVYVLDEENRFGPEYIFKLDDIPSPSDHYLKAVVQAEIQESGELTASFSAKRGDSFVQFNGENYWRGFDLEPALLTNKLGQGIFAFKLEPILTDSDELIISFWNRNGLKVEIENIKVYLVKNNWN